MGECKHSRDPTSFTNMLYQAVLLGLRAKNWDMFRNELSYKDCYKNCENNEKYKILRGHRQNVWQETANKGKDLLYLFFILFFIFDY